MRRWTLSQYAISSCVTAALLAGCGSQPPISAPLGLRAGALPTEREHPPFGTVFAVTRSGKTIVLHRFGGGPGDGANPYAGLIDVGGTLYGTTTSGGAYDDGTVFEIAASGAETVLHSFNASGVFGSIRDGLNPRAGLVNVNGTLYGDTLRGGATDNGSIFSITPSGTEALIYSFGPPAGAAPAADLLNVNGTLYGTT
ncbi:MAG: choice-of-anchor tandem repeat GloVer-containing protein, partial [Candidatus Cybelea sp.]